jgi:hypothetical protein
MFQQLLKNSPEAPALNFTYFQIAEEQLIRICPHIFKVPPICCA